MNEMEKAIIGCLAGHYEEQNIRVDALEREDFQSGKAKMMFDILNEVATVNDGQIDLVLISQCLNNKLDHQARTGEVDEYGLKLLDFIECTDCTPSGVNFKFYVESLKDGRRTREMIRALDAAKAGLNGKGNAAVVNQLHDDIQKIYAGASDYSQYDLVTKAIEELEERQKQGIEIPTGFKTFDSVWGGLFRKEMHVIAGDSGHFKTTLTLNLVLKPLELGKKVLWFDGEIGKERLIRHLVAIKANIETWRIRKGILNEEHWQKISKATEIVSELPFVVYDDVTEIPMMREKILRHEPDVVVIDNIQNMDFPKGDSFWTFHMGVVGIKRMAMSYDVALVALSQVTRTPAEIRTLKPPTLENLFGSRSIKQNADCVTMVYWPWKDAQANGSKKNDTDAHEYFIYHMKMREEGLAQKKMYIDAERGMVGDSAEKHVQENMAF